MRTAELNNADLEHVIHPNYEVGRNSGIVFEKAKGVYLVDTEGKEYIDMASGNCCCNLGHGREEIITAITEALNRIDFTTSFYGHSNPYTIECAQKLASLTPGDLDHFHFTNGGSESVDTAIKTARLYWYHKGQGQKSKIISLYDSYHGVGGFSTYATGTGHGSYQAGFGPGMPEFIRIPSYYCYRCIFSLSYPECDLRCARFLEETIQAEGADSIAAFIAEGMIGGGGFVNPPPEWWPMISDTCRKYNVLLIADEIITGFARTGKMFCMEHWNIQPDMMTMAKGITSAYLPFGAMAINNKIYEALKGKKFKHGYTYSGHAIPAAASCAALDIYIKEGVVENAAKVGSHIKQRLDAEFQPLPAIGNVAGMGINYSLEFVSNKETKSPLPPDMIEEFWRKLYENGIYTRLVGRCGNRLHIGPPCTITVEEADKALDIILALTTQIKLA
jgi:4-aminobutyrate--pyruvate transaminase